MRNTMIATAIAIFGFGISVAEAMPIAPIGTPVEKNTVLVDYACGRGFHISPWVIADPTGAARRHGGTDGVTVGRRATAGATSAPTDGITIRRGGTGVEGMTTGVDSSGI
ncbi:hypothetical protein [Rhizobium sp. Root1220]|uniref:hypothetical protein n=1 Tax=Rhizobium sp. Root1220 TaxID=1736432 RepID=UPI000A9C5F5F|nr:hypothetical protein [Rhizobium sp. Root1220]